MSVEHRPLVITLEVSYADGTSGVLVPIIDFRATVQDSAEGGSSATVTVDAAELENIGDRRHITITGARVGGSGLEDERVIFAGDAETPEKKEEILDSGEVRYIATMRSENEPQDYGDPRDGELEGDPQDGEGDEERIVGINVELRPGDGGVQVRNPGEPSEQKKKCEVRRQEWTRDGATETVVGEPCESQSTRDC